MTRRKCSYHVPLNMTFQNQSVHKRTNSNCIPPTRCQAPACLAPHTLRFDQHILGWLVRKCRYHRLWMNRATKRSNRRWMDAHHPCSGQTKPLMHHSVITMRWVGVLVLKSTKLTMTTQAFEPFSLSLKGRTLTATLTLLIYGKLPV